MAKVVLTTKRVPTYDDLPEVQYHFPSTYLNQIKQAVGDAIVYYEPRRQDADPSGREGRQVYFAVARISKIRPDRTRPDHYYADIVDYLDFDRPVPFREGSHFYESAIRKSDGSTNRGAFGRAVRLIPDKEFDLIRAAGFSAAESRLAPKVDSGFAEEPTTFDRPIHTQYLQRPFREAAFSRHVRQAYNSTCAVTGLCLRNGGGRPEVEAAHIRPIGDDHNGPDSIRNGIALCRTVHWMFDRGLISLADDYSVLLDKRKVPDAVQRLIRPSLTASVPDDPATRLHPQFLRYHREQIYKG